MPNNLIDNNGVDLIEEIDQQTTQQLNPASQDNYIAVLAAALDSEIENKSIAESFYEKKDMALNDQSYSTLKEEAVYKALGDFREVADNVLEGAVDTADTEVMTGTAEVLQEVEQRAAIAASSEDAIEEMFLLSKKWDFDERVRQERLFQLTAFKHVASLLDENDTIDNVADYAGLLLPDRTLDWYKVADVQNILETPEQAKKFINRFQTLPANIKEALFPEIAASIKKASKDFGSKNNVKAAMMLLKLIDPTAEKDIQIELQTDALLAAVDVVPAIAALRAFTLRRVHQLGKAANAIKAHKAVDDVETAASLNVATLADETGEASDITRVSKEAAAANATPFDMENILPNATDGINLKTEQLLERIQASRSVVHDRLQRIASGQFTLKEGALLPKEKDRVQSKALEKLMELNDDLIEERGLMIDKAVIAQSDETGFTINYELRNVADDTLVGKLRKDVKYRLNDVGEFEALSTGAIERYIASPSYYMSTVQEGAVEGATRIELARERLLNTFTKTVREVTKPMGNPMTPIGRRKYKELDEVLLSGDDYANADGTFGRVYTIDELRSGIRTRDDRIIRLDDSQIQAYYGLRELFDNVWSLKNNELRRTMELNGFKHVDFEGVPAIGHPFATANDARNSLRKSETNYIYDPTANDGNGGFGTFNDINLDDMYQRDYAVVRFQKAQEINGEYVDYALVPRNAVKELPQHVLHYKVGYVPKIHKEGYYFVKKEVRGTRNGRPDTHLYWTTVREFDSKKGAQKYLDAIKEEEPNASFRVFHDRELDQVQLNDEAIGFSGGLYTSPRAKHPILFNEKGEPVPRESAFESLSRNLQHIAGYLPRNEWRIGMQQRWLNTARDAGMLKPHDDFWSELRGEKHTEAWNALTASRDYIKDQMRIPTSQELWFSNKMRALAEWAEKPITFAGRQLTTQRLPEYARKSLQTFTHKDPFALARSAAFHTLLGWFNPAQLFVQAQGASIAMSIHPERWATSMQNYMALRAAMVTAGKRGVDASANGTYLARLASTTSMNKDEFVELVKAWEKTGLQESIKATADHAAAAQSFGYGADALRRAADAGLVLYREGELFTRGYSFLTAAANWKKANKGKKLVADEDIKAVLDEAMKLQLNMTRANRAAWQKGAFSIPTQFLQIQAKWLQAAWPKVLGGKGPFTVEQKQKFLAIQFMAYGAAGIPFGEWAVNEAAEIVGTRPENMDPTMQRYVAGGVWDAMFYAAFGADAQFGKRGAIADVERTIVDLTYSNQSLVETMFGAFGSVPTRAMEAFKKIRPLVFNSEIDFTMEEYSYAASQLASIVSTWRNIDKAIFMNRQGLLVGKNGRVLVDRASNPEAFSPGTITAQALGFSPRALNDLYKLDAINRNWDQHVEKRIEALIELHYKYASGTQGERGYRNLQVMQQYLLGDLNDYDREYVLRQVGNRIKNPQTKMERVLKKYYRDVAGEIVDYNPLFGGPATTTVIPKSEEQQ